MTRSTRDGITLVEVLVVLLIIGALIALILPATRSVRVPAERARCMSNLRQMALAFNNLYSAETPDGRAVHLMPSGCLGPGKTPEERLSWMVEILPCLEENRLHQQFDMNAGYAGNLPAARTKVKLFLCPAGPQTDEAVTHYVAMAGIGRDAAERPTGAAGNGFMGYDRQTPLAAIEDGTSNTIALMETRVGLGPWARGGPSNLRGFDPTGLPLTGDQPPFGGHPGTFFAAMADGSVREIRYGVNPKQLAAAITIAGGERFDLD